MFKFASQKIILVLKLFLLFVLHPTILFAASNDPFSEKAYENSATIDYIQDEQYMIALSDTNQWNIGELLPVISQNAKIGIFAYVELVQLKRIQPGRFQLKLKIIRQSRRYLIQQGDFIKRLNLGSLNSDYIGTTDLIVKKSELPVSSRYKALVYQGIFIGETAQSLLKNEVLLNFLGNAYYGITDDLMIGSYLPLNILTGLNGNTKYKVYDSESTTLAAGLNYAELKTDRLEADLTTTQRNEATLNLNLFWDSVSSDTLISHIYLSLGLIKWEGVGDATAVKTLGSSSFQTGYELILSQWDRFLIGPSYNFDTKALGGYLSYIWIYDKLHLQASINTTNIVSLRVSPKDGYYGFFDMYWRF